MEKLLAIHGNVLFAPSPSQGGTVLMELTQEESEYVSVDEQMQSTIREHKDAAGGIYMRYNILKVGVWQGLHKVLQKM